MKNIKYRTMYREYLMVKKYSKSEMVYKIAGLEGFYEQNKKAWKIIGITIEALKLFAENNFKIKDVKENTKSNINRSHFKMSRNDMFKKMLEMSVMSFREWYTYYTTNDVTVLATSSENMKNKFSKIIDMNISENTNLFKLQGFGWRHSKEEVKYLENLYNNNKG